MKKFVKVCVVALVVLLAAAIIIPMAFRGKIEEIVKKEANAMLNARLDFERLDISLLRHFPHASVELKGLTLTGVDRFEGDTVVAARRISVVVNLMSLFGDSGFEVTRVILAEPALHARKLADGAVNWDVMKPSDPAAESLPAEEEEASEPSSFRLSMKEVRIEDAVLSYVDDSTRMSFSAAPVGLRLRGDLSADKADLDLRFTAGDMTAVSGGIPLLSRAEAELKAVIEADLAENRYTFANNTLRLNAIEMSLDGWVAMADEAMDMDLALGCEKVQFKEILSLIPAFYTKEFKNLTASGELSLSAWVKGRMQGDRLPAFEFKLGVGNGSFRYASLPKAVTDINIAVRAANPGGTADATTAELSQFTMTMAGNSLSASASVATPVSDPAFSATVKGKVDLGAVKEVYPLDKGAELGGLIVADLMASGRMSDIDKQRYEQMKASGTFVIEQMKAGFEGMPEVQIRRAAATITPAAMTLGELGVTVGASDLTANGQLTNYLGYLLRDDVLSGRLYVKSDLLDLNELMSAVPASDETAQSARTEDNASSVQAIEVPRNLNLTFSAEVQKILFNRMTIEDFTGNIRVAGGTASLDKLAMKALGGSLAASGSYSTAVDPQRPQLKLALDVKEASFQQTFEELEMVQKLVPLFSKTGGNYGMTLDMNTALDAAMSPDLQSLNADGEIRSANIQVQNLGVFDKLAEALNNDKLRSIEAKDVTIRFSIADGRISTQPFDLKMGNVDINMSGTTGLDQTIDYTAAVSLPEGTTGGVLSKVNVGIGGTFTSPKITLGVKEAVKEAVTNVLNEQIQKLTGSESVDAELQKQAEKLREEARLAGEKLVAAAEEQKAKLVAKASNALTKAAAEKAGDKLVKTAQEQADKLNAEAEEKIAKLTAGKSQE